MRTSLVAGIAVSAALATAAATTTAITPAGAAPAGPTLTGAVAVPSIDWGRCADKDLRKGGARCGFLTVPMDYDKPGGRKLKIAVSRIKATAPSADRQGPLLSNPGGPGGQGIYLPLYLASALPKGVARSYDLIGFDPRGVGASKPALDCGYDPYRLPQPAYRPTTGADDEPGANERAWLRRAGKFAKACKARYGELLPHLGTTDVVADMDTLRQALHAERISYYGFSYGTAIGQVYATEYPDRVRRMILDGNLDATVGDYEAQDGSARAFESSIHEFFGWVADHDKVYGLGRRAGQVEKEYYAQERRLTRKPLGTVGPADFNDVLTFTAGYSESAWPDVASAFARLIGGQAGPFRKLAKETLAPDPNGVAIQLAVNCLDSRWPSDYATWREDAFDLAEDAPFRAWSDALSALPCRVWPVKGGPKPPVGGFGTPELLLVSTTGDGVTPYANSLRLRQLFPRSVLLAERGSIDHTAGLDDNTCINEVIFRYLGSGELPDRRLLQLTPGADKTCASNPRPKPLKVDRQAAGRDGLAG